MAEIMEEKKELIRLALEAREKAYVPYSDFMVGAALRAADGRIYTGCNVENAAFTPTSCAERTALFKAVADGVTQFTDIAVVGSRRGEVNRQITSPCGVAITAPYGSSPRRSAASASAIARHSSESSFGLSMVTAPFAEKACPRKRGRISESFIPSFRSSALQ